MEPSPETNALLRARLDELLGDYERAQASLATARERMRSVRGSARSGDGTVSVQVDARGQLAGLDLEPRAYQRFSPSLLAAEIMRLTGAAVADVNGQLGEIMAPFLPAGMPYDQVASGEADLSGYAPPQPLTNETYNDWRARISGFTSTDGGGRP